MNGRGPYAKSAATKRAILDACITAFGETGFHGVSMAEISRRAAISQTGLLHHFPSKEILLRSVLALLDLRTARYIQEHADHDDGDPLLVVEELLEAVVGRRSTAGTAQLATALPAEATAPTHPAHEHYRERYSSIRSFLSRHFSRLQEQSRMDPACPPDQLAAVVVALTDGLRTQWLYEPEAIDVEREVTVVLRAFIPELESR